MKTAHTGRFHLCFFAMKSARRLGHLIARLKEYLEWVRLAEEQTGKGLLTQAREILTLKQAGGQCGITDYYWFKLYDEAYMRGQGSRDFLGWRLEQSINLALNPRQAVLPAWDKIVFIQLAAAAGLPVPQVRACFHKANHLPNILGMHLKTLDDAAKYLRDPKNFPLFAKPAYSQQGYGSLFLAGYDPRSDGLMLTNGKSILVKHFLSRLIETVDHRYHKPECGFLFQEPLKLAPEIESLTGWPAICGVRIICLNGSDGVRPLQAAWKIAVPPNYIDNFHGGRYGNLDADIDIATGEVIQVLNGYWPKATKIPSHPYSHRPFQGFKLSGWRDLLEICRQGGAVFPLMKIHHWDFALTDRGPVILELNDLGGSLQIHGRGLLTEETREFLKKYVDCKAHPWVNGL